MTADVEPLPVAVSPYTDRILAAVRAQDCADPLFQILDDYARANVLHHTATQAAEIEALRAEVEQQKQWLAFWGNFASHQSTLTKKAEARAERLAEALRDAMGYINSMNYPGAIARIDALLRDQEEGKRWT